MVAAAVLAVPSAASAADGRIAFVSERDGNAEIYVMEADGSSQQNLTNDGRADDSPAWSPDGSRIAFARGFADEADIWVMNADGSEARRLAGGEGADRDPVWSPDGRHVAFAADRGSGPEIHVVDASGSGEHPVTATGGVAAAPDWSPDGVRIAFWREDLAQVRVVAAAGGADVPVGASADHADRDPAWSPDGSRLVFSSYRDPALDLDVWAMQADGSGAVPLASSPARDMEPAWSAAGEIAFASDRDGDLEIYAMADTGDGVRRLTGAPGDDRMPAWQPAPVSLTLPAAGGPVPGSPAPAPAPAAGAMPGAGAGAPGLRGAIELLRSSRVVVGRRRIDIRLRVRLRAASVVTLELRTPKRRVLRVTRRWRAGVRVVRASRRVADRRRLRGPFVVHLVSLRPIARR